MWTFLLLAAAAALRIAGFDKPESAYWDAGSKTWYISNVAGEETGKDGNGWISTLEADGKVSRIRWVGGLNAPKGIRVKGSTLYVSDVDELVVVDIPARKVRARIKAPGAGFLNDVAVGPQGEVYVSDTFTNAIYKCTGENKCEAWLKGENLAGPNGLLVDGNRLIVASFGVITDRATFKTKSPGHLLAVDLKTKKVTSLGSGQPIGNLDGLEKDGDDFLVSDFMAGKFMRVSKTGTVTVLDSGFKNSADFGWDPVKRVVLLPEMGGGTVEMIAVEGVKPPPKPAAKPAEKSKKPASRR